MRQHTLEEHKDGCPIEYDRPGTCMICSGGLAFCTTCHGGEAELPTECPGVSMTEDQRAAVLSGHLDYTEERGWYHPALKPVNV